MEDIYPDQKKTLSRKLFAGVVLEVPFIEEDSPDAVRLIGHVKMARTVKFRQGLMLNNLLQSVEELKPEALLDYALLHRYNPVTTRYEVQKFPLKLFFAGSYNVALQPRDQIEILSRSQLGIEENISVSGAVWRPGTFTFYPGMSVAEALALAGGIKAHEYIEGSAYLYRYDAQTLQYRLEKLDLDNAGTTPEKVRLQPFDRISLLSRSDYNFNEPVHVAGAVRKGGEFVWHPEMTVKDIIDLAGGVHIGARMDRVEISRIEIKSGKAAVRHLVLDLKAQDNLVLQPYDYVFVPQVKDATRITMIQLNGEVRYPGTYSIAEGERLSQVIERAGGFTEQAYFYGAIFTSPPARKIQQQSIDKMLATLKIEAQRNVAELEQSAISDESIEAAQLGQATSQKLIQQLSAIKATGRISICLAPLSELTGSESDLELQDGDTLFIPLKPSFVSVIGSVYSPNSYLYRTGLTVADYLKQSGGPTKQADEDYIYIQHANGEVLSVQQSGMFHNFYSQELMPGDTIVVLEDFERVSALRMFKDVTEIIFRIAMTAGIAFAI